MQPYNRWVFLSLVLASSLAAAAHRPAHAARVRPRPSLAAVVPAAPAPDAGARMTPAADAALSLEVPCSFFDQHATLVRHDLLLFHDSLVGVNPSLPNPRATMEMPKLSFVQMAKTDDLLEVSRQRDRLLLFREQQPLGASLVAGLALFAASMVGSAHGPRSMRFLFDRLAHLGPAIFEGGGMGMGVGGTIER